MREGTKPSLISFLCGCVWEAYDPPSVLPGPSPTLQVFREVRRSQPRVLAGFYLDMRILLHEEHLCEELNI